MWQLQVVQDRPVPLRALKPQMGPHCEILCAGPQGPIEGLIGILKAINKEYIYIYVYIYILADSLAP